MKLEDLKLGQEVTVYKYYFNLDNDIKVSELKYYVHNIEINSWQMFDKKDNVTKSSSRLEITLYALKPDDYNPHSLEIKSEDGNEFKTFGDELCTELYSLNNDDEALNKFKSKTIEVLKHQAEYYLNYEKSMHREYLTRLERLNKLILNYDNKGKSE